MSGKFVHFQAERINTITPQVETYRLSANESGSIVFCDPGTSGTTIYLPSLPISSDTNNQINKGLNFTIIINKKTDVADFILISIDNSSATTEQLLMSGNGVPTKSAALFKKFTIASANIEIGDRIDCVCDGHKWYLNWNLTTTTAGHLTLTT